MLDGKRGHVSTKGICRFQDRLASKYVTCEVDMGSQDLAKGAGLTEGLCQYSRDPQMCLYVNLESAACVPALVNFYLYQM